MYANFNIYRIAFSPYVGFFSGWGNEHIFSYLEDLHLSHHDDRENPE